jgi:hypothetical protein
VVRDKEGNVLADDHLRHAISFRDGLIAHLDIRSP